MNNYSFETANSVEAALTAIRTPGAKFIGGGTNLLDLAKAGIERPSRLIDINRLGLAEIRQREDGGLTIGALARNSDVANHPLVRERYPLLAQALLAGASPQLRNMATVGGNLLQRTRCYYFYDTAYGECNKRIPGSGCAAQKGFNRIHAVLGTSAACIAVNPSDMSVALVALDAIVRVRSSEASRDIAIEDFHRLPGDTPEIDNTLHPDELIVSVELPAPRMTAHSHYLKIRDRQSYAFALVSVAAGLEMDGSNVRDVRIVLGGVAHKPWRAIEAEAVLRGQVLSDALMTSASRVALNGARGYSNNGFKIPLATNAVKRTLETAWEAV